MTNTSIAKAVKTLEGLATGLNDAYWEASTVDRKDFFYDIISAVHSELSEIGKLSVLDHDLAYEAITADFRAARVKLIRLHQGLDDFVLRSATATRLYGLINEAVTITTR